MRIRTLFRSKFLKEISTRTYDVQSYIRSCSLTSLSSAFNSSSRCCMVSFLASKNVSCHRSRNQLPKRGLEMDAGSLGCGITPHHVFLRTRQRHQECATSISHKSLSCTLCQVCIVRQCVLIITASLCHIIGNSLNTSGHHFRIISTFWSSSWKNYDRNFRTISLRQS